MSKSTESNEVTSNDIAAFFILGIFALAFLIGFGFLIYTTRHLNDEYTYRGVVVSHGYEQPTSGHKSSTDPKYFIMMKEDLSGKVIRINVTIPTYHSLKDGDRTVFTLSNVDLHRYGNSTDPNKNLYEQ